MSRTGVAVAAIILSACSSTGRIQGLSCKLGGGCSQTQICTAGIEGCASCKCLDGTWQQAPCPTNLPQTGSACTPAGAQCGYATGVSSAAECSCDSGAWSCGPTGVMLPEDAGDGSDGGTEASGPARCVAAGGRCVAGAAFCANVAPPATAKDCDPHPLGPVCCAVDDDAGCTEILAANYDQSCTIDSDCVRVGVGNACYVCTPRCDRSGAINARALAQYMADIDKTPAGAVMCSCAVIKWTPTCCLSGHCHIGDECVPLDGSTDAADAHAE